MTQLSVNLNKFALLRNSRGRDYPNLVRMGARCLQAGTHGIWARFRCKSYWPRKMERIDDHTD